VYVLCCSLYKHHIQLAQLVKYDVHTTRKIKSIHSIIYHILLLYQYIILLWYQPVVLELLYRV